MTDFALYHENTWKAGGFRNPKEGNVIVCYDQTYRSYKIDMKQLQEFKAWVAWEWTTSGEMRAEGETLDDFLDRADIQISFV